jgi:hypothetical protein
MKTKMTIHRALSELKLIDAKIAKSIREVQPVGIHQKGKLINGHIKQEDFATNAKSKSDSIEALFNNKVAIKTAIVESNTKTKVTVAGKEYSVADAITFKSVIATKKQYIDILKNINTRTIGELNKNNEIVNSNIQKILEASLGKDNVKTSGTEVDAIRKPFMEANEFHLFDPLELTKKIEALDNEVTQFEAEVDATLSESNAVTLIEI